MAYLPVRPAWRSPRTSFAEVTPAVLRCQDGHHVRCRLKVISLTGGLLGLSKPLDHGSQVKVMFMTITGSVLGAAEMLSPVSWGRQPFKFTRLYEEDAARLGAAIQSSLDQNHHDHDLTEHYRAW